MNTQEIWALADKSAICSAHTCFMYPASKLTREGILSYNMWLKVEHRALEDYGEKIYRGSKHHWL